MRSALSLVIAAAALVGCSVDIDVDGDGYSQLVDCNDYNADVFPGADERCDLADNDCDGLVDEGDAVNARTFWPDADGDRFGDSEGQAVAACATPKGFAVEGGDCDDTDARRNPGALEWDCGDPVDWNCDGSVGFEDADGDGHPACRDCNDDDATVNPAAIERCDGVDEDCDGVIDDEATDTSTWWADLDGDRFGNPEWPVVACTAPAGFTDNALDCDDIDREIRPGADERCNLLDDDCDGEIDEDAIDEQVLFRDLDGDGYGNKFQFTTGCFPSDGLVVDATDCNDSFDDIYPGAPEYCDGWDSDCDGRLEDEDALDASTFYVDLDKDGFGDNRFPVTFCVPLPGHSNLGDDCDDTDPLANPDGTETCGDGIDQDCDGADETCST